jgi:hypothetical protein
MQDEDYVSAFIREEVEPREWLDKSGYEYNTQDVDSGRKSHLKRCYGMTMESYQEMLESQNGLCKICGRPPMPKKPLFVDHNHANGDIRGLLCNKCNSVLGFAEDNTATLEAAKQYLLEYHKNKLKKC